MTSGFPVDSQQARAPARDRWRSFLLGFLPPVTCYALAALQLCLDADPARFKPARAGPDTAAILVLAGTFAWSVLPVVFYAIFFIKLPGHLRGLPEKERKDLFGQILFPAIFIGGPMLAWCLTPMVALAVNSTWLPLAGAGLEIAGAGRGRRVLVFLESSVTSASLLMFLTVFGRLPGMLGWAVLVALVQGSLLWGLEAAVRGATERSRASRPSLA